MINALKTPALSRPQDPPTRPAASDPWWSAGRAGPSRGRPGSLPRA